MRNFIKRLFCKHNWKCVSDTVNSVTFECNKCGKRKTYWN